MWLWISSWSAFLYIWNISWYLQCVKERLYHGRWRNLLCIKKYLQVLEEPQLDVEAELKLTHLNRSSIHICAFYCPPNADSHPIEQLRLSITNLLNQSNTPPHILLMGDFNFPGITWSGCYGQIDTPTYRRSLYKLFLDIINDASLEQFVYTYQHAKIIYWIWFSLLTRRLITLTLYLASLIMTQ